MNSEFDFVQFAEEIYKQFDETNITPRFYLNYEAPGGRLTPATVNHATKTVVGGISQLAPISTWVLQLHIVDGKRHVQSEMFLFDPVMYQRSHDKRNLIAFFCENARRNLSKFLTTVPDSGEVSPQT